MNESYIPIDPDDAELQKEDEANLEASQAIRNMMQTDGWEVLRANLQKAKEIYTDALLKLPATNENLAEISRFQSLANGAAFVLDLVKDLANYRKNT